MKDTNEDLAQLLQHFDIFNDEHFSRRWEVMEYARDKCPVAHSSADGGLHLVTRYEHVKKVLSDPDTFSSVESSPRPSPVPLPPLDVDPPLHGHFRKLLNRYFTRPYLRKHEPVMREIAREAIAAFADRGRCEFISEFAIPFTSATAAKIVFDEDDKERMARAVAAVEKVARENSPEAYQAVAALAAEYMTERQDPADDRDDLISAIARGEVDGRPLTVEERIGVVTVLFIGGLDTTRGAISNIAANVARHPELEGRLRNPDWIRSDLDEFLRFESPVLALRRQVTKDCTLGGASLKAGDIVMLLYASANRDKSRFPDADRLDFTGNGGGHLAFGFGIHRCVGATLARIQIEIAFDELFKHITNLRWEGPDAGPAYEAGAVLTPTRLVLGFDPVAG
ncbi:cytochrome P450 [Streptomyces sp. NWU339]|uniref:cytochrome P450 n=1 Tax=Streptomyces sp. NWU339 TaxID=2185284 RepID=UPI000D677D8C|nr:cytochrome P450 [Streptomyces sp. NWU339]PWI06641.1 cytochrome P450 [Streptomyces sp. NWU339]